MVTDHHDLAYFFLLNRQRNTDLQESRVQNGGKKRSLRCSSEEDLKCLSPDVTLVEVWNSRLPFGDVLGDPSITAVMIEQFFCPVRGL